MPRIYSYVTRAEETRAKNNNEIGPSSYIPTEGVKASAFDAYRTFEIDYVENQPESWSMMDVDSIAALGRLIDGPITNKNDLAMAEQALKGILLHDSTQVLVPSLKVDNGELISYKRLDKGLRNQASYQVLQQLESQDILFSTEYLQTNNNVIISSTNPRSRLVNQEVTELSNGYNHVLQASSEVSVTFPNRIGATTYFSNELLTNHFSNYESGFIKNLYDCIERPWFDIAQSSPPINISIKLPPLLAIVLSRAAYRDQIPETIAQLRAELALSRQELIRFNNLVNEDLNQRDYIAQVDKIHESFNAIVPESLMTDAERMQRKILSIWNLVKPVANAYVTSNFTLYNTLDEFLSAYQSIENRVKKSSRLVSRNIPAANLADLLKVNNITRTITDTLTKEELRLFN